MQARMSRFESPIIDCCATWSTSSGWQPLSVSAAIRPTVATDLLKRCPREFATRSMRPTLAEPGRFDNAARDHP